MPLSGMTGFGRADGASGGWTWAVEARSVNGRGLEVRFRGPSGFDALERTAREAAQARFQRGQLNVTVQARLAAEAGAVKVNRAQLDRYLALSRAYVEAGQTPQPTFEGLMALPGVIEQGSDDAGEDLALVEKALAAAIAEALDGLKAARLAEGAALAGVFGAIVDDIEALTAAAGRQAEAQPLILKERFARRMAELVDRPGEFDERVVQEAAVMAGRADVREELDRLGAHVAAARALLAEGAGVGRRFDFLTQEFMREANTLCSKSATTALTAVGLELKAAIDQLREQVQNVE
ncbi:MAG TPA: YicC/YloC family endoribonuclease [Caulobacteraceae bacterium]|nr:YicC/YloC family endoribonuclease [Caulobacteraceae bacterium]